MVSIPGRFEYDDDSLTPGQKKEGGLHSNLYDSEGNLRANARFIPDDPENSESATDAASSDSLGSEDWEGRSHWTDEDEEEGRRRREEQEQAAVFLAELVSRLVIYAIEKGGPPRSSGLERADPPRFSAQWAKVRRRRMPSDVVPAEEAVLEAEGVLLEAPPLADFDRQYQINMAELRAALDDSPSELAMPMPEQPEPNPSCPGEDPEQGQTSARS